MEFNAEEINAQLAELLRLNRSFTKRFTDTEYDNLVQEMVKKSEILHYTLYYDYTEAINLTLGIESKLNILDELRRDDYDTKIELNRIREKAMKLKAEEAMLVTMASNLKAEGAILEEVKKDDLEKVERILSGNSNALNEASMSIFGKRFGDIYSSMKSRPGIDEALKAIDSAKQIYQNQAEQKRENGTDTTGN